MRSSAVWYNKKDKSKNDEVKADIPYFLEDKYLRLFDDCDRGC